MSKREKIILFVMVLAIGFGVYNFFIASPSKRVRIETGKKLTGLNNLIVSVTEDLNKAAITEAEAFIIARAEAEWVRDPFFEKGLFVTPELAAQAEEVIFTYTGYMEMGKKRLAVINGLEYRTGEELELGGYVVRSIHSDRVVIKGKGRQELITVPFKQEVF